MKKSFLFCLVFLLFFLSLFCQEVCAIRVIEVCDYVPRPRLIYPVSEKINLEGSKTVAFKWSPHESRSLGRRSYDFRVYKGTEMTAPNLVYNEMLSGEKRKIEVNADIFENGKTYTWSIRQVYRGTGKSTRNFNTFRIVK